MKAYQIELVLCPSTPQVEARAYVPGMTIDTDMLFCAKGETETQALKDLCLRILLHYADIHEIKEKAYLEGVQRERHRIPWTI